MATVVQPTRTTTRRTIRVVIELLRARRVASPAVGSLRVVVPVLLTVCLAASAGAESSAGPIGRDSIGNGIELPHRLWIAGDVTLHGQVPEHGPARGEIDDLSLLARWEPTPRLTLFGELRLEDVVEAVEGEGGPPNQWAVVVARL